MLSKFKRKFTPSTKCFGTWYQDYDDSLVVVSSEVRAEPNTAFAALTLTTETVRGNLGTTPDGRNSPWTENKHGHQRLFLTKEAAAKSARLFDEAGGRHGDKYAT